MKKLMIFLIAILLVFSVSATTGIQVSKPGTGQDIEKGTKLDIKWTSPGCSGPAVKINIFRNSINVANFVLQLTGPNKGSKSWFIPGNFATGKYILRVKTGEKGCLGDSGVFNIVPKKPLNIGIIQVQKLKTPPPAENIHRHRAPAIGQPTNASFSIEKIYYDVNGRGKLTNVKVMITYKSKTAFSFNNYKGHPQDGPVYLNCLIWNPKWPDGYPIYAEKGPPTGEILFNHRLSVKYAGKNHLKCAPEIHNIGSGMFQLIFTPSHSNRMQGLDTYQKMGGGGPFSPSRQCKNSYPPKMAVRVFIHTKEGVKNMYKEFYLKNTTRKTIPLPGKTESCPGGIVHW